ncbi:hypothetical protein HHJ70_08895 [Mobiluncus curtisii]|uniref:Uncharacterized protein n=4 Tax=Actinomycetaceae TaxID=2049 RepID=E6M5I4_9ACTO|nr:hypothetical protein HMPREF0388_0227 [Mobiluncus curtisii ATCC 51333]EFU81732.1 hypothetical protein HMPREF0576_1574 [Mobiluncus holmesii ATCC 35242]NMW46421.1 hypothetical protein [Mobiluncus curtisii]
MVADVLRLGWWCRSLTGDGAQRGKMMAQMCYWGLFSRQHAQAVAHFCKAENHTWLGVAAQVYNERWRERLRDLEILGDYINELEDAKASLEALL